MCVYNYVCGVIAHYRRGGHGLLEAEAGRLVLFQPEFNIIVG